MLGSSNSLKTVVVDLYSIDLLLVDENPLEWMKTLFALFPHCDVLHTIQLALLIRDASEEKLDRLFRAWVQFHEFLTERFKALQDVRVDIYFGWLAGVELNHLLDSFDLPTFAQSFPKRLRYKFEVMRYGEQLRRFSYCTL